MIQTVVVLVLLLAGAALAQYNLSALQSQVTLAAPRMGSVTAPLLIVMAWIGGAFILAWLAGLADREILSQRIRRDSGALRVLGEELSRMKAASYDRQQPLLADIRTRLDAIDRDLRSLGTQVGERLTVRARIPPVEERRN